MCVKLNVVIVIVLSDTNPNDQKRKWATLTVVVCKVVDCTVEIAKEIASNWTCESSLGCVRKEWKEISLSCIIQSIDCNGFDHRKSSDPFKRLEDAVARVHTTIYISQELWCNMHSPMHLLGNANTFQMRVSL